MSLAPVAVIEGIAADAIPYAGMLERQQPVILRGIARDWPLVRAGLESPDAAISYLKRFEGERPVTVYAGAPEIGGRFFYNDDVTGMNYAASREPLGAFLDRLAAADEAGPSFYMGSTDLNLFLPGLRGENDLALNDPMFAANPPIVSIWIGNRTIASAHYDMSHNMACCVAGRRRFTLFPPDQVANLYPGPLEPTPGGQVVSMVDFRDPDFARYPRFRDALETAQVAELEPGDLLFYPALWWHHVEALAPFNVLVNYWWNTSPAFMDNPQNTVLHAMLSLRDRPDPEKAAWRALFDYYVFGPADRPAAHLPEAAQGNLAPLDETRARRLRANLLNRLNR
ncbi:cupin-like domain-containing protein [Sphingomonas soli]|uniref:cupin-like domain-containing protein n=1 Tax=Sphingomonas soli TaxID=266127 RepID=UPI000832D0E1|nr:cupin-like domain-containing protein [Sphingomonas soli]